jgi:transcriptional regulator with XRE-family HTH domain
MDKSEQIKMLAKRIRSLRVQKGYTSYESFAFEKGIHRAQYGRYEIGTDIQFTSLIKIAQSFGMTLEEFFSEDFEDI